MRRVGERPDWLDDDEQRAWRAFIRAIPAVLAHIEATMKAEGITTDDFRILSHLSQSDDDRARMSELAAHLATSRSRLTYRMDLLDGRGLTLRRSDPDDGRAVWACLTPTGRKLIEEISPRHVADVRRTIIDHFDRDTWLAAGESFARVRDHLRSET